MNQDGFIAEIAAQPHEVTPRLVFADWLEDQGDPRGEFIRVQCELASPSEDSHRRDALDQRQEQLRRQHQAEWLEPLAGLFSNQTFHRGMVEQIEIDAEIFVHNADRILSQLPIRFLRLYNARGWISRCLQTGLSTQLLGFAIEECKPTLVDMQAIAAASWPCLQTLSLTKCQLTDALFEPLAAINAPDLLAVELSQNRLRNSTAQLICQTPTFSQLQSLDLLANEIRQTGARAMADCDSFSKLELLDLRGNPLSPRGALALLERFGETVRLIRV